MKKVLVGVLCTIGAAACGESRPAGAPSASTATMTSTAETASTRAPGTRDETSTSEASTARSTASMTATADAPGPPGSDGSTYEPVDATGVEPKPASIVAPVTGGAPRVAGGSRDADNTNINDRDRQGAVTPTDQGGGNDREITAALRRSVVADKALSFTAKNVKIVTVDGKVTLRGRVESDVERSAIEAKATPGVSAVDNQLDVKK